MKQQCDVCGSEEEFIVAGVDALICPRCGYSIPLTTETFYVGEKLGQIQPTPQREVLEEGDVVRIDNADHVWHGEIAIIRGVKHKFYRLEFGGRLTWVPSEWVHKYEPSDST